MNMLKKGLPEKLGKNYFNIHFIDVIGKKRMPGAQKLKKIEGYYANDSNECKVKLQPKHDSKTIFIDLTVNYPEFLINNPFSLDELIEREQNEFINFYNNIMG